MPSLTLGNQTFATQNDAADPIIANNVQFPAGHVIQTVFYKANAGSFALTGTETLYWSFLVTKKQSNSDLVINFTTTYRMEGEAGGVGGIYFGFRRSFTGVPTTADPIIYGDDDANASIDTAYFIQYANLYSQPITLSFFDESTNSTNNYYGLFAKKYGTNGQMNYNTRSTAIVYEIAV